MSQQNLDEVVAKFEKNSREEVWISLGEYHGRKIINVRVHYRAEDGEWRPGKQGLAVGVDKYRDLAEAILQLGKKLQEHGFMPSPE